jgi:radical SAM enzyme (TIGR01210 family)
MTIEEYTTYKNFLINIMKEIRKPMYSIAPDTKTTYLYFEKTLLPPIDSNGYEKNYMMPFLILISNPCSHILRRGGCTMCGYSNLANFNQNITGDLIYEQFRKGLEIIKKIPRHEMVAIGTGGSFLDPNEVPFNIQSKIIKDLSSCNDIHYINIEARAEFITEKSLENIVESIDDPYKLSIGVGLESSNDLIRELCINKCMNIESFIRAIKLLKKYNISPTVYVTIGKPFINDWTNIKDTLETIKFAFQHGADRVVLLRIGVQRNTLIEWLYRYNMYKPIKIWAIVEVLKRLPEELRKKVLIANPRLPKHLEIEENGDAQTAIELLSEYKGSLDYSYIEAIDTLISPLKEKWYTNLEQEMSSDLSVEEQIRRGYMQWLEIWKNTSMKMHKT